MLNSYSIINLLLYSSRYASAICGVSLPQHNRWFCKRVRNEDLATKKLLWTLKYDENLHGFALLNMGPLKLIHSTFFDPFIANYAANYLRMAVGTTPTLYRYNLENIGNEIHNISEYRNLSEFFQDILLGSVSINLFLQ